MRKQPEPLAVKNLYYDAPEAERFIAYVNQLIEERALLLAALQKVQALFDRLNYEDYAEGEAGDARRDMRDTMQAALEKATT